MKLEKTLNNLRGSKDSFFNLNDCYIDYDLFKNGIKTFIIRENYKDYILYKKEFTHHSKIYGYKMPNKIIYYLRKRFYHYTPKDLNYYLKQAYIEGLNYYLLKLK
jgi:hypothetical protein